MVSLSVCFMYWYYNIITCLGITSDFTEVLHLIFQNFAICFHNPIFLKILLANLAHLYSQAHHDQMYPTQVTQISIQFNTFTPPIKGICYGLNVMYHIPQFSGVLQLPLECVATSYRNAYNYAATSNGMLQKYQGVLILIPKTPLLINTTSYKAQHIDIDCWFELK